MSVLSNMGNKTMIGRTGETAVNAKMCQIQLESHIIA